MYVYILCPLAWKANGVSIILRTGVWDGWYFVKHSVNILLTFRCRLMGRKSSFDSFRLAHKFHQRYSQIMWSQRQKRTQPDSNSDCHLLVELESRFYGRNRKSTILQLIDGHLCPISLSLHINFGKIYTIGRLNSRRYEIDLCVFKDVLEPQLPSCVDRKINKGLTCQDCARKSHEPGNCARG